MSFQLTGDFLATKSGKETELWFLCATRPQGMLGTGGMGSHQAKSLARSRGRRLGAGCRAWLAAEPSPGNAGGNSWGRHCCLLEGRWRPKGLARAVREQQGQVYEEWQAQEPCTVRPSRGTVLQYLHKMSRSGNSSESWLQHANQRTSEEQEKVSDESAGLDLRYLARHSSGKDQRQQTGSKHTSHTKTALLPAVWAKVTAAPCQSWCWAQAGKQLGGMWWGLWCRLQTPKGLLMVEPGASCANGYCRHSLCLWAGSELEVQG